MWGEGILFSLYCQPSSPSNPPLGLGGPCLGNRPLLYLKTTDVFGGDSISELQAASPKDKRKAGAARPPARALRPLPGSSGRRGIQVRTRRGLGTVAGSTARGVRLQRLGGWPRARGSVCIRSLGLSGLNEVQARLPRC